MANGYAKIEGKPPLILAHGTVGLQHASMALYNAWCDRVPIYMMAGNTVDATKRASAGPSGTIRCRTRPRWCATSSSGTTCRPRSQHFGESAVRAYKIAITPPMAPVLVVADSELQEGPIPPHEKLTDAEAAARRAAERRPRRDRRGGAARWSPPTIR